MYITSTSYMSNSSPLEATLYTSKGKLILYKITKLEVVEDGETLQIDTDFQYSALSKLRSSMYKNSITVEDNIVTIIPHNLYERELPFSKYIITCQIASFR